MTESTREISGLGLEELKALLVQALEEVLATASECCKGQPSHPSPHSSASSLQPDRPDFCPCYAHLF